MVGQVAGLRVDNTTFAYRVQAGDTPAAVAANLGTLIRPAFAVAVSGSSVTVPGAGTMLARVVADTPAMQEVRRQVRDFASHRGVRRRPCAIPQQRRSISPSPQSASLLSRMA